MRFLSLSSKLFLDPLTIYIHFYLFFLFVYELKPIRSHFAHPVSFSAREHTGSLMKPERTKNFIVPRDDQPKRTLKYLSVTIEKTQSL